MPKNMIVLTGSPRRGGNSDTLADSFIEGAEAKGHSVFKFETAFHRISACAGCNICIQKGEGCVIHDDFYKLVPHFENADVIVFASPLYWCGVSAQLKLVWDRFHAYTRGKGRARQHIKESVFLLTLHEKSPIYAPLVSIYKDCGHFMGWTDRGVIAAGGLLGKDDIKGSSVLQDAYELGKSL